MQQMLTSQLPLSQRIPALTSAIKSIRTYRVQLDKEEAEYLELLKQAEQELKAHPPGSEGAEPSGLLEPEKPAHVHQEHHGRQVEHPEPHADAPHKKAKK